LNQQVVLEPLEGPSLAGRIRSFKFRVPRNLEESSLGEEEVVEKSEVAKEGAQENEIEEEAMAVLLMLPTKAKQIQWLYYPLIFSLLSKKDYKSFYLFYRLIFTVRFQILILFPFSFVTTTKNLFFHFFLKNNNEA
jgi:hypothetical protein